jgi:uncharacterized protein
MTNFIPLFPLNIVVYPGEKVNLHIFEPRYKQLIRECFDEGKEFGIATVLQSSITEFGTTLKVLAIEHIYESGEMDIRSEGVKVFKILEHIESIPNKLFGGAIVTYPDNNCDRHPAKMKHILNEVRKFHQLLEVSKKYTKPDDELTSYDLAHHMGLSLEKEYQLLCLMDEGQRQEYLQQHLKQSIPTITELNQLKKRIEMNGHFRKLSVNDENDEA